MLHAVFAKKRAYEPPMWKGGVFYRSLRSGATTNRGKTALVKQSETPSWGVGALVYFASQRDRRGVEKTRRGLSRKGGHGGSETLNLRT